MNIRLSLFLLIVLPWTAIWAETQYSPASCDYAVIFPSQPVYSTGYLPQAGKYIIAEARGGDGGVDSFMLKAECIPVSAEQRKYMDSEDYMLSSADNYATSNGLQNPEYRFQETTLGKKIAIRAFKKIDEIPVTFEVHMYLGRSSFLSLYVGGSSKNYPPDTSVEFLKSVSLKQGR